MKRGLFSSLLFMLVSGVGALGQEVPKDVSPQMRPLLDKAVSHMNNSRYDSAAIVLSRALTTTIFNWLS